MACGTAHHHCVCGGLRQQHIFICGARGIVGWTNALGMAGAEELEGMAWAGSDMAVSEDDSMECLGGSGSEGGEKVLLISNKCG